jgi:hypothetical protein
MEFKENQFIIIDFTKKFWKGSGIFIFFKSCKLKKYLGRGIRILMQFKVIDNNTTTV